MPSRTYRGHEDAEFMKNISAPLTIKGMANERLDLLLEVIAHWPSTLQKAITRLFTEDEKVRWDKLIKR
jgi:hypothetical protein